MEDLELYDAIKIIAQTNNYSPVIQSIAQSICDNGLCRENVKRVLDKYGISNLNELKNEFLDFIINYIEIVLDDHVVSEKESKNVILLKTCFNIKEGDFYKFRYGKVSELLHRQFERIYSDGVVTNEEEIHKFEIQDLFDLSYDQFLKFKKNDPLINEFYIKPFLCHSVDTNVGKQLTRK